MSTARDFADLQDRAIAALETGVADARSVEPYAGQVEDAICAPASRFPFLTVLYTGTDFEHIDGQSYRETNEYEIGVYVHSLRGAADLKSKAEELIRTVKTTLVNQRLATNAERTVPLRVRLAIATDHVLVYGLGIASALDVEYEEPAE